MSLFSTFYAGDPKVIEETLQNGSYEFPGGSRVTQVDFSGGVQIPFLFPEDFQRLVGDGDNSFWKLERNNLLEEDERGLYRVPDAEVDRLRMLNDNQLKCFADDWNRSRAEETMAAYRSASIWRSEAFWMITAGISLAMIIVYLQDRSSYVLLYLLASWLVLAWLFGSYTNRRRAERLKERRPLEPIDWTTDLKKLQEFLQQAKEREVPVYYHWSL
ncbi:MAG: hypothetical protein ACYTAS_09580 [Planctomycetota bacterium]|jgi:hypothetical protein